jgi:hypothetical protein
MRRLIALLALAGCASRPIPRSAPCIPIDQAFSKESAALIDQSVASLLNIRDPGTSQKIATILSVYARTQTGAKRLELMSECPAWPVDFDIGEIEGVDGFVRPGRYSLNVALAPSVLDEPGKALSIVAHLMGHAQRKRCFPSAWRSAELEEVVSREAKRVHDEGAVTFCGLGAFVEPREPGLPEIPSVKKQLEDIRSAIDFWSRCKATGAEGSAPDPMLARGFCPSPGDHYTCFAFSPSELSLARDNCAKALLQQPKAAE